MLKEDQLKLLKEKLLAEKSRLETQIKNLGERPDFGSDIDHLEEEADETEEATNTLGLKTVFQNRLRGIEAALQKMENGNFGICEKRGEEIDFELLEADPESKLCRECKKT